MDSLESLDWEKLVEYSAEQARTEPGFVRIESLFDPANWASDPASAQLLQAETLEASGLLDRDSLWGPLTDLASPSEILESLAKGSVLSPPQLGHLRRWLSAIAAWTAIDRDSIPGELFRKSITALGFLIDPREPLRTLERVLSSDGNELSENASPKYSELHREIRELRRTISSQMERIVQKYSAAGVLQDSVSDVHDGRFVVPVRVNEQAEVDGIIFGTSASRQTVFIEPSEISPMNNRLRSKQNELAQEAWEILDRVSRSLRPFTERIEGAVEIIARWDSTAAKARLGRIYEGKPLFVGEDSTFVLRRTANPLLWWSLPPDRIARNDLEWGDPVRTLLLTGPNTGGKTVLLKTLGLAGICARTGFPFPGEEGQNVPFFDSFFVDVGDSQSIESHLSSFSGHIERFKTILARVTPRSLVLLDELNSATDPTEGAALGRAFLETVMARGALIVGTTHDPQLKALALNDDRILNASMEFDESSKSPSYRILFGVPGRSRALETAERLGIPSEVLDLARGYLTTEHNRFENLLARLESDAKELESARREANRLRDEAERLKREWTERTEKNVGELLDRTRAKLRHILDSAQDDVRAKVRKLEEARSRKEIDRTRGSLNESFSEAAERIESALREEAPDVAKSLSSERPERADGKEKEFRTGETVRVPKFKNLARVLDVSGEKIRIQMGALQMTVSAGDLEKASETEAESRGSVPTEDGRPAIDSLDRPDAPDERIDLRGKRFDEAMSELEAYLDVSFRSGARAMVTIVHGVGTGAIREGTRALLKRLPYVKDYRDGGAGGGGAGATIVEFEES